MCQRLRDVRGLGLVWCLILVSLPAVPESVAFAVHLQDVDVMSEAVQVLGVSERHGWRLLAAYRKEDTAAIAHRTGEGCH